MLLCTLLYILTTPDYKVTRLYQWYFWFLWWEMPL